MAKRGDRATDAQGNEADPPETDCPKNGPLAPEFDGGSVTPSAQGGKGAVGVPAPASVPEFLVKVIGDKYGLALAAAPYRGSAPLMADMLGNQMAISVPVPTQRFGEAGSSESVLALDNVSLEVADGALVALLGLDRQRCNRPRLEALHGDLLAALLARAELAGVDLDSDIVERDPSDPRYQKERKKPERQRRTDRFDARPDAGVTFAHEARAQLRVGAELRVEHLQRDPLAVAVGRRVHDAHPAAAEPAPGMVP